MVNGLRVAVDESGTFSETKRQFFLSRTLAVLSTVDTPGSCSSLRPVLIAGTPGGVTMLGGPGLLNPLLQFFNAREYIRNGSPCVLFIAGAIVRTALTRSHPGSPVQSAKKRQTGPAKWIGLITQRLTSQRCFSAEKHFTLHPLGYLAHLARFLGRGIQQRCGIRIAIKGPEGD